MFFKRQTKLDMLVSFLTENPELAQPVVKFIDDNKLGKPHDVGEAVKAKPVKSNSRDLAAIEMIKTTLTGCEKQDLDKVVKFANDQYSVQMQQEKNPRASK